MRRGRLVPLLVLALGLVLIPSAQSSSPRTYEVTITNLTATQPFTPPVTATHSTSVNIFDVGSRARIALKEIAENGNLNPMVGVLSGKRGVDDVVVAVAGDPPPLLPGQSVTFTITADRPGVRLLSFASMLICTNDGFTGVSAIPLPAEVGDTNARSLDAYDAGTEVNTEDFADIVPPCPALSGVASDDAGSGSSNPALAEGGVIHEHAGVQGGNDLTVADHGWNVSAPVAHISVTRTG